MRRYGFLVIVACAFAVSAVGFASTERTPSRYNANLDTRQEVPAPKGANLRSGGSFSGKLDGNVLTWTLKFHGLTGAATAAHIHLGAKGKPGPVIVPLCGPCKSPTNGKSKLNASTISSLADGKMYVNVHTVKNPNGEIRGQVH